MNPPHAKSQPNLQPCYWPIRELPGLSDRNQIRLQKCGINTTEDLLAAVSTLDKKQELARRLQMHIHHVNKWLALADLARIPSVGCQYCGLLLHSGIISAAQLAQMPIHTLHQQVLRLHVAMIQRRDLCPPIDEIARWIQQAKLLNMAR
ncbi:DUF4332 domain-containing protein [Desertifilum sp. FACHB-1129]|uniref:DUF4332 domain-containing protein n=2 Tax=Desertifilum tharense IPPAS B-1220 TaxID=1781255 RepID=A0A1E5QGU5_9CYAN|nr:MULTISPECIES: DUF4332 domain-containing protein [Desertifilum]MDA0211879.1 DUF4332 domain-containing protein [Cyanobacteria bacterium FC1]MDI9635508.1 DUF4332 domain-containing protein [Geitlerinema splendidum]NES96361.1 DUF4332 domain-containing protein [Desertifilum sp. SIO1I2]MBD2314277.1 DUF4332 domain-containing protein [Desertifilum sp. FACHB-1129]MBD2320380.1 DUF4332 domain-containing protein [Desertifilum sp. FACHB-866]